MHLQEVISKENKRKPLTDDALVVILKEQGYNIARNVPLQSTENSLIFLLQG